MARSTQGVASTMPWVGAFRRALSVGSMMQADLETTGRVALDACFSAGYCSRLTIGRREHVSCSDAFLWIASSVAPYRTCQRTALRSVEAVREPAKCLIRST